jgi:hypothetical protein
MKLFVWNSPYGVSYGGSIGYAVAETEEEARAVLISGFVSEYGNTPRPIEHPGLKLGKPDRVMDLPYGEFYEWSE